MFEHEHPPPRSPEQRGFKRAAVSNRKKKPAQPVAAPVFVKNE